LKEQKIEVKSNLPIQSANWGPVFVDNWGYIKGGMVTSMLPYARPEAQTYFRATLHGGKGHAENAGFVTHRS